VTIVLPILFTAVAVGLTTERSTPRVRAAVYVVIALVIAHTLIKG